jgi:release factor glutamine methyltransferase
MNAREIMLTAILDCDRTRLYADPKPLTSEQQKILNHMESRLIAGEPLQYIVGFTEFMGLKIQVDHRVLIPRPETEIMVELALEYFKRKKQDRIKILDLGTGSGNIAIALAYFLPYAHVTSVDVSSDALIVAAKNAMVHKVRDRIDFIHMDMKDYLSIAQKSSQGFDFIISNPPYIKTNDLLSLPQDVQREPKPALDGGEDGLSFYRIIVKDALPLLSPEGICMMEMGDGQHADIQRILENEHQNFQIDFAADLAQTLRIAQICHQPTTIEAYG